jgi:hypothetical protein
MGREIMAPWLPVQPRAGNVTSPVFLEPLVTMGSNSFLGVLRWVDHFGSLVLTRLSVDGYGEKYALSLVLKFGRYSL